MESIKKRLTDKDSYLNNKSQSNIPRFLIAGILVIAISVMWVNNKNKAELKKQNELKHNINK